MASLSRDAWMWFGLGVIGFSALRAISDAHTHVLRLAATQPESKRTTLWEVTQDTEDSIDPEALHVLATSDNYNIRKAATQILTDRFCHTPNALASLKQDLISTDPAQRLRALRVVKLIARCASKSDSIDAFLADLKWLRLDQEHVASGETVRSIRPQQRTRNESREEQEQRRRRREAIVLNEGDRPLSQDDIIQRGTTSASQTVEERRRLEEGIAELTRDMFD